MKQKLTLYVMNRFLTFTLLSLLSAGSSACLTGSGTTSSSSSSNSSNLFTDPPPLLYNVFPQTGATAGGTVVELFGNDFQPGATVTFGGLSCTNVTYVSPNYLTCTTPISLVGPGATVIEVTNPDTQTASLPNVYSYVSGFTYLTPQLSTITPNSGTTAGGTSVTIVGQNFSSPTVTLAGIQCSNVVVLSSSTLQCTTGAACASGTPCSISTSLTGAVVVTNGDGKQATSSSVTYTYETLSVTSVSPAVGPVTGGQVIDITGNNFMPTPGQTTTVQLTNSSGVPLTVCPSPSPTSTTLGTCNCTNVIVNSSTQLECTTPAASPSPGAGIQNVSVTVTNPDGTSATGGTYSYTQSPTGVVYTPNTPWGFAVGVSVPATPTPAITASVDPPGTYSFSISPSLPGGMSINSSTGVISGTLEAPFPRATYTVTASESTCISAPCPSVTSTPLVMSGYDFGNPSSTLPTPSPTFGTTTVSSGDYAYVTFNTDPAGSTYASGSQFLNVTSIGNLTAGDSILIIQMQNQTAPSPTATPTPGSAGYYAWEFSQIDRISGNVVYLSQPTVNSYVTGTRGATAQVTQIVRAPLYTNVTISSGATYQPTNWSSSNGTGGVVVLHATNSITINGSINASGAGFNGGTSADGNNQKGNSGESFNGTGSPSTSANDGGGGGGGVGTAPPNVAAAGGGGGFGAAGGTGTSDGGTSGSAGGLVGGVSPFFTMLLGSGGGGAAHTDAGCSPQNGAAGGGMIILVANTIQVASTGSIVATGAAGSVDSSGCQGDVSGSGSGGSVLLIANNVVQQGALNVSGGASTTDSGSYKGGAGGNGLIRLGCTVLGGTYSNGVSSGSVGTDCGGSTPPTPTATPAAAAYVTTY